MVLLWRQLDPQLLYFSILQVSILHTNQDTKTANNEVYLYLYSKQ